MDCSECASERLFFLTAKASDRFFTEYKGEEKHGYAPTVSGICGGDYVEIEVCLDCGKVQGPFPVEAPEY